MAIRQCDGSDFAAIAYKSGMTDSDVTSTYMSNMGGACNNAMVGGGGAAKAMAQMQSLVTVTIISVWDGDWALLEEYAQNASVPSQGYHGLVKTLNDNIYYYQDSLGSTSHVANANGQLLEWYKYDVYGKPKYFDASNSQLQSSNYQVADLGDGGARWMPELGLYDDRNRFMSPDLGRFLQPDPIGFKGDASNLYRYCGNDWGNRTDPTGLLNDALNPAWVQVTRERAIDLDEHAIRLGSPAPGAFQAGAARPTGWSGNGNHSIGQESITRSNYPTGPQNHGIEIPYVKPKDRGDGYIYITPAQRAQLGEAAKIVKANTDSREAHMAVTYNSAEHSYGITDHLVKPDSTFQGGQKAYLPTLPSGPFAYAGQVHSHTNGYGFSSNDIGFGNYYHLPVVLINGGNTQIYIPRVNANPNSGSVQGNGMIENFSF